MENGKMSALANGSPRSEKAQRTRNKILDATAYEYPISKRTLFYFYAGYGQGKQAASSVRNYKSWTVSAGLSHNF